MIDRVYEARRAQGRAKREELEALAILIGNEFARVFRGF